MAEGLTPCYTISESTDPDVWGTVPTTKGDNTWDAVTCDFTANGYRLPTEAEWEYAARAGDTTTDPLVYSGTGDSTKLGEYAWCGSNSDSKTHEVKTKKANSYGLYDMSGNVGEWCWDWYESYSSNAKTDPIGASSGSLRVFRNGGYRSDPDLCAVSSRGYSPPIDSNLHDFGFRVVRTAK